MAVVIILAERIDRYVAGTGGGVDEFSVANVEADMADLGVAAVPEADGIAGLPSFGAPTGFMQYNRDKFRRRRRYSLRPTFA